MGKLYIAVAKWAGDECEVTYEAGGKEISFEMVKDQCKEYTKRSLNSKAI